MTMKKSGKSILFRSLILQKPGPKPGGSHSIRGGRRGEIIWAQAQADIIGSIAPSRVKQTQSGIIGSIAPSRVKQTQSGIIGSIAPSRVKQTHSGIIGSIAPSRVKQTQSGIIGSIAPKKWVIESMDKRETAINSDHSFSSQNSWACVLPSPTLEGRWSVMKYRLLNVLPTRNKIIVFLPSRENIQFFSRPPPKKSSG
jgi:hypothetical protein